MAKSPVNSTVTTVSTKMIPDKEADKMEGLEQLAPVEVGV